MKNGWKNNNWHITELQTCRKIRGRRIQETEKFVDVGQAVLYVPRSEKKGSSFVPEIHGRFPCSCALFINHSTIIRIYCRIQRAVQNGQY